MACQNNGLETNQGKEVAEVEIPITVAIQFNTPIACHESHECPITFEGAKMLDIAVRNNAYVLCLGSEPTGEGICLIDMKPTKWQLL